MNRRQSACAAVIALVFVLAAPNALVAMDTRPAIQTLEQYFDLLASGNLSSAAGLWTEPAIERSARFGIEYIDIPLKIDCASPIVRNLPIMRDHLYPAVKQVNVKGSEFIALDYSKVVNGQAVEYTYYAYFDGNYFWLTYPQDYYCRDWPVLETKYFRIHYAPGREAYLHEQARNEADRFIEALADSLDLSGEDLALIGDKKIEYFYCEDDSTVAKLTGHRVKGMLDLASNDLISAFFPHYHEIAHLLVNLKLRRLPLYTQPLLREGTAVYYGGRWGKGLPALNYLGAFLHTDSLVRVDSIITMSRFEAQAGTDMAYPVAGLFCSFLMDRMGRDRYFELYSDLSGPFDNLYAMVAPVVKRMVYEAAGADSWGGLLKDFDAYIAEVNGRRAVFRPGLADRGKVVIDDERVRVRFDGDWISLEFNGDDTAPPVGNLFFGHDAGLDGVGSELFDEQYRDGQTYNGYRWGVRFDGNEAGLYDYLTNRLIAKYIFGITPSDDYIDADNNTIRVRYSADLTGGTVPQKDDFVLWPN